MAKADLYVNSLCIAPYDNLNAYIVPVSFRVCLWIQDVHLGVPYVFLNCSTDTDRHVGAQHLSYSPTLHQNHVWMKCSTACSLTQSVEQNAHNNNLHLPRSSHPSWNSYNWDGYPVVKVNSYYGRFVPPTGSVNSRWNISAIHVSSCVDLLLQWMLFMVS